MKKANPENGEKLKYNSLCWQSCFGKWLIEISSVSEFLKLFLK